MHAIQNSIAHYVTHYQMDTFLNDKLLSALEIHTFEPYSHIFEEDTIQTHLYFLVDGLAQCSHYHLNGKLAIFAVSRPFAAIGELEILDGERLHSTVIATQKTTMLGIRREIVREHGATDARFLRFLFEQTRDKLYTSNAFHKNQTLPVINRFVVHLLCSLHQDNSAIMPDKDALASLLGTSVRHLNRVLKQLVNEHTISDSYPHITVLNRAKLETIVSDS